MGLKRLVVTGHRPGKLYRRQNAVSIDSWLPVLSEFAMKKLARERPDEVISGMALGWDMACALACVTMQVPFIAAVPFEEQPKLWSGKEQRVYRDLLGLAAHVEVVCNYNLNIAYQKRNEYMVDHGTHCLALWNGTTGGTYHCLQYAAGWAMPIKNVWDDWTSFLN